MDSTTFFLSPNTFRSVEVQGGSWWNLHSQWVRITHMTG